MARLGFANYAPRRGFGARLGGRASRVHNSANGQTRERRHRSAGRHSGGDPGADGERACGRRSWIASGADPSVHATRLADQYAGEVLYLIAWIGDAAGDVNGRVNGAADDAAAWRQLSTLAGIDRESVVERCASPQDRPTDRPVGHVLIRWRGSTNPTIRSAMSRRGRHPYLEDRFVHTELRSRSIGSQLLAAAERQAAGHGYEQVGLAVAIENVRARALYEREGYRDAEIGPFASRSLYLDGEGRLQTQVERCVYLMKRL